MLTVQLGNRGWRLRPVTGLVERAVTETSTRGALALLDAVLESSDRAAESLSTWERHRLLAALYRQLYGDRITSSPVCSACREVFDIAFELDALVASIEASCADSGLAGERTLASGTRFRLPTGADELAMESLPADGAVRVLVERCLLLGDADEFASAVDDLPLLDLDLDARCGTCGAAQSVRFSLQRFLLARMIQDQRWLLHEIHHVAAVYGWSLAEILDLSRDERRRIVAMIRGSTAA